MKQGRLPAAGPTRTCGRRTDLSSTQRNDAVEGRLEGDAPFAVHLVSIPQPHRYALRVELAHFLRNALGDFRRDCVEPFGRHEREGEYGPVAWLAKKVVEVRLELRHVGVCGQDLRVCSDLCIGH